MWMLKPADVGIVLALTLLANSLHNPIPGLDTFETAAPGEFLGLICCYLLSHIAVNQDQLSSIFRKSIFVHVTPQRGNVEICALVRFR